MQLSTILAEADKYKARLVAVSKTHSPQRITEVYAQGQRIFGENRVQELIPKYEALPKDIEWHLIGSLQTNKVKFVAPFVSMIHSVDSEKLLLEIDKQAAKHNRNISVLLQFHIAQEDTKQGLTLTEAMQLLQNTAILSLKHVRLCGVMGMATYTDDQTQIRKEFKSLKTIYQILKDLYFDQAPHFTELSMGMSSDWQIALEEGSTLLRIGSLVFGER